MKTTRNLCGKTFEHPFLSKYLTKEVKLLNSYQLIPSEKEKIFHSFLFSGYNKCNLFLLSYTILLCYWIVNF